MSERDEEGRDDRGPGARQIIRRAVNSMPEPFESRCKVCTSKFRHAIERMIALGTKHTEIERIFNGEIPRRSISNHAREHLSYEQAAIREILEHESHIAEQNYEEGLHGALMYRSYLSAALKRGWDDLVEGNVRVDPSVAIQLIQQLDKFDKDAQSVAVEEIQRQFLAFQQAVKEIMPPDLGPRLVERYNQLAGSRPKGSLPVAGGTPDR